MVTNFQQQREERPTLAILEGTGENNLGAFLDFLRSSLGNAVSNVQDRLKANENVNVDRYELGKVFFQYVQGVLAGTFPTFDPQSSAPSVATVQALLPVTVYDKDTLWYAFYELFKSAQAGESGSSDILKPTADTLTLADKAQYSSVASAVSSVVTQAATSLGLDPSALKTILLLGAAGGVVLLLYRLSEATKRKGA